MSNFIFRLSFEFISADQVLAKIFVPFTNASVNRQRLSAVK